MKWPRAHGATILLPMRPTLLLATLALLTLSGASVARDVNSFDYHGWHIDASRASTQPREPLVAAVQKQIDAIETRGIAQDIIAFMRTVPLHAVSTGTGSTPAHYDRAKGLEFRADALDASKPVLLPELLRAFHEQKLKSSAELISKAYEESRASGTWPADSAMMKSVDDFFVATSTVYLFGPIDTPPFTPGRMRETQPAYWQWLGEVFDGFRGCE